MIRAFIRVLALFSTTIVWSEATSLQEMNQRKAARKFIVFSPTTKKAEFKGHQKKKEDEDKKRREAEERNRMKMQLETQQKFIMQVEKETKDGRKIPKCRTVIRIKNSDSSISSDYFDCILKVKNQKKLQKVADEQTIRKMRKQYVEQLKKEMKIKGREVYNCHIEVYEVKHKGWFPLPDWIPMLKEKCMLKGKK